MPTLVQKCLFSFCVSRTRYAHELDKRSACVTLAQAFGLTTRRQVISIQEREISLDSLTWSSITDETLKRIIIIPEEMNEDTKKILFRLLDPNVHEVSAESAKIMRFAAIPELGEVLQTLSENNLTLDDIDSNDIDQLLIDPDLRHKWFGQQ